MIYISPFIRLSVRTTRGVENKSERGIGRTKSPQYPSLPSIFPRPATIFRSSRPAEDLEYVRFMPSLQWGLSNLEDTTWTIKFNQRNEGMVFSSIIPCISWFTWFNALFQIRKEELDSEGCHVMLLVCKSNSSLIIYAHKTPRESIKRWTHSLS